MSGAVGFPERPVFSFGEGSVDGSGDDRQILGGKGAGLAEMSRLGIPVPPGFTVTTPVCNYYYADPEHYPGPLEDAVEEALALLEKRMDQGFGAGERPLLVSVRSGAAISMPGMMDTVLNVGLNPQTLEGLQRGGDERFALDCYRRLIEMYGDVVCGVPHHEFSRALAEIKENAKVVQDNELTPSQMSTVIDRYLEIFERGTGQPFPEDPREQLWGAINAVFESWMAPRAVTYRRIRGIPNDLGTAVNVQAMVFGNLGETSATGVCFTRDPSTGEPDFFGEFLPNAQGEDVVAGIRTPQPMRIAESDASTSFEGLFPDCYKELCEVRDRLEQHYGDMQDIEFTVQEGRLFLLQTRRGQRTGAAALRIACDMHAEGLASGAQALHLIEPESLSQILAPEFSENELAAAQDRLMATGLAASPGAASGAIAFTADQAVEMVDAGAQHVILVRQETSPEDIAGMEAADGIITTRGGKTSHAAVVARGMGKPCVVGCESLHIDEHAGTVEGSGLHLTHGEAISLNGTTGAIYSGSLAAHEPEILQVLEGHKPESESTVFTQFQEVMKWADEARELGVRTNVDTPEDARRARLLGAQGIGLCRTEHMFFGPDRIRTFRRMILASSLEERQAALDELLPYQRDDFAGIFRAMDGLPVTIRLLDPPLHEFLPHGDGEIQRFSEETGIDLDTVRRRVDETSESNPMLGLRGCRLGLAHPEIYLMQVRAIFEAALLVSDEGIRALPEIMIPLTAVQTEVERLRELFAPVIAEVFADRAKSAEDLQVLFGTMIEIPRAALTADAIAKGLDFFSFGTNDLTQMTLGLSRDDTAQMLTDYVNDGLLPQDPFTSIDIDGVGSLMRIGVEKGRAGNSGLKIGICGEHGGDPKSVAFCHELGFDYVSCSPFRLPVARLAAAQAAHSE